MTFSHILFQPQGSTVRESISGIVLAWNGSFVGMKQGNENVLSAASLLLVQGLWPLLPSSVSCRCTGLSLLGSKYQKQQKKNQASKTLQRRGAADNSGCRSAQPKSHRKRTGSDQRSSTFRPRAVRHREPIVLSGSPQTGN